MSAWLFNPPTLAELLPDLLVLLDTADMPRDTRERLRAAVHQAARPTVHWARPRAGVHVIEGERHAPGLIGLDAAWCAIAAAGQQAAEPPQAAEFCAPGAAHADVAVRAALKRAAAYLAPLQPALAETVRSIRVIRGALVWRARGRIDIVTT